jgi:hypothetical protein
VVRPRRHYDYHDDVTTRSFNADDLTALLERLRLQQAGPKFTSEVTRAQVDQALTRIASLTEALRSAEDSGTARLASRLLLSDLALVAAQFRAGVNEIGEPLTRALEDLRAGLEDTDSPSHAR